MNIPFMSAAEMLKERHASTLSTILIIYMSVEAHYFLTLYFPRLCVRATKVVL